MAHLAHLRLTAALAKDLSLANFDKTVLVLYVGNLGTTEQSEADQ